MAESELQGSWDAQTNWSPLHKVLSGAQTNWTTQRKVSRFDGRGLLIGSDEWLRRGPEMTRDDLGLPPLYVFWLGADHG